jgi:general secretion pathway protein G
MQKIKISTGFTMIELLVVMAIISILAGMSIFAMQGARESARDAARRGDLEKIATALEFYKADCHTYPPSGSLPTAASLNAWEPTCLGETHRYLEQVPGDPLGGDYAYRLLSPNRYTLCSTLEDPPDPANDTADCGPCAGGFSCEYKVTNP